MAYSTGILDKRVSIIERVMEGGKFGKNSAKPMYRLIANVWANVTFSKGVKSMREGALDAYDTLLIRMRWNNIVSRESFIGYQDKVFMIISFNEDKHENIIQLTVQEIVADQTPMSSSSLTGPEMPTSNI